MPEAKKPEDEAGPRSFAVLLQQIADGECHTQLSEEFHTLVKATQKQAKARVAEVRGVLNLKVTVKVDEHDVVDLSYDITRKEPAPRRARSTFWVDKSGHIVAQNPKQIELGLKDVSKNRPAREAAPANDGDAREVR
jgi:hypothetical protein